ncbi:hypothetical protein BT93_C1379 [Corymbia citriodora subsp. variegata]|nr:hypothetical protein BT93_C1379 [Corymbia citriodora subsp. variegata]
MSSPNSTSPRRLHPRKTRRTSSLPVDLLRNESLLPLDLLRNVLSCLPTISLVQLRSVCKEWCDIIDNPYFAAMQATSGAESPRILLISRSRLALDSHFVVDDEFLVTLLPRLATRPWLNGPWSFMSRVGHPLRHDLYRQSSDPRSPLVAVVADGRMVELAKDGNWGRLPDWPVQDRARELSRTRDPAFLPLRAEILDQGSRSWRDIVSVPPSHDFNEGPVFAAGSIHWKTGGRDQVLRTGPMIRISSFNLTKEEFAWTPCPEL